jgi:hypothetical protein
MTIKAYSIFLGAGDRCEVWLVDQHDRKLRFISSHELSDDAVAARNRYREADARRTAIPKAEGKP